jgi:ParB family transcriptional regulator, chromosome partitioning protein
MLIPVDTIIPNPEQPRKTFDQAGLQELADSIKLHGLINPIAVEDAGDHYILIDGERRWRAAQLAGLEEIEASVRPGLNGSGQVERLVLATVANLQRADMNPLEKAQAFQRLMATGLSQVEVARMVGMHTASIGNYLLLLRAPESMQVLFAQGKLPSDAAAVRALLAIADPDAQRIVANAAARRNLPASAVIALARKVQQGKKVARRVKSQAKSREELSSTWAGKWNMIAQAGNPHISAEWRDAALATCNECPLIEDASPKMCRDCAGPGLLRRLVAVQK